MTAPRELLGQLDEARASIGDSPAFRVVGFVQDDEDPEQVLARFDDEGTSVFAECYGADAAALIVAAVNRLPQLVAALRAALTIEGFASDGSDFNQGYHAALRHVADAITAALSPAEPQSGDRP